MEPAADGGRGDPEDRPSRFITPEGNLNVVLPLATETALPTAATSTVVLGLALGSAAAWLAYLYR